MLEHTGAVQLNGTLQQADPILGVTIFVKGNESALREDFKQDQLFSLSCLPRAAFVNICRLMSVCAEVCLLCDAGLAVSFW